jgi:transposase
MKLIQTAKLKNVDPMAYMTDVLERLSGKTKTHALRSLLPWNWTASAPSRIVRQAA